MKKSPNESKYCQNVNCIQKGKEQDILFDVVWSERVGYGSKKSERKKIVELRKFCFNCKDLFDKTKKK